MSPGDYFGGYLHISSGSLKPEGTLCTSEPSYATPGYVQRVIYTSNNCTANATFAETYILNNCIEYSTGNVSSKQITYDGSLFKAIEYSDATCGVISTSDNFLSSALNECTYNGVDDEGVPTYTKVTYSNSSTNPFTKPATMASSATVVR